MIEVAFLSFVVLVLLFLFWPPPGAKSGPRRLDLERKLTDAKVEVMRLMEETSALRADADNYRRALVEITRTAARLDYWRYAVDQELVSAHLGTAPTDATLEGARRKLKELIEWHVAVATDPKVNGGFELVPARKESAVPSVPDGAMTAAGSHDDLPRFLRWVSDELVRRDTRAGSLAAGIAASLRGRAAIIEAATPKDQSAQGVDGG